MAIDVTAGFNILVVEPVDSREVFPTLAAAKQLATNRRYQGLKIFVQDEAKLYWFQNGVTDADLVEFASGGGGTIPTPVAPDENAEQGDYADAKDTYDALQTKANIADIPDISGKVDKQQNESNAGMVLGIGDDGMVTPVNVGGGGTFPDPVCPDSEANDGDYADASCTYTKLQDKVSVSQGEDNAGKYLTVDTEGTVVATTLPPYPDITGKVDKQQDANDAGKVLGIGNDGMVTPVTVGGGGTIPDPVPPDANAKVDDYADAKYTYDALQTKANTADIPDISGKVDKDQGVTAKGKYLTVDDTGHVITSDLPPIPDPDISGKVDKFQGTGYKELSLIVKDDGYVGLEQRAKADLTNLTDAGEEHFTSRFERKLLAGDTSISLDRTTTDGYTIIKAVAPQYTGANRDLGNLSADLGETHFDNRFERTLKAGANIALDRTTEPGKTIISSSGGGDGGEWADQDLSNLSVDKGEKHFSKPLSKGQNITLTSSNGNVIVSAAYANWTASAGNDGFIQNKPDIPDTSNFADKDLATLSDTGEGHFQKPLTNGQNITITGVTISAAYANWNAAANTDGYIQNKPTIPNIDNLAKTDFSNLTTTAKAYFQRPLTTGVNIEIKQDPDNENKDIISANIPDVSGYAYTNLGNLTTEGEGNGESHFDYRYSRPITQGDGISITTADDGHKIISSTVKTSGPGVGLAWDQYQPTLMNVVVDGSSIGFDSQQRLTLKGDVVVSFQDRKNDDGQVIGWKAINNKGGQVYAHTDAGTIGPNPIGVYVRSIQSGSGDISFVEEPENGEGYGQIIPEFEWDDDSHQLIFHTDTYNTSWINRTVDNIYDEIPSDLWIAVLAGVEATVIAATAAAGAVIAANKYTDALVAPMQAEIVTLTTVAAQHTTAITNLQVTSANHTTDIAQLSSNRVMSSYGGATMALDSYAPHSLVNPILTSASGLQINMSNWNQADFANCVNQVLGVGNGLEFLNSVLSLNIDPNSLFFDAQNGYRLTVSQGVDFNTRGIALPGPNDSVRHITMRAWFDGASYASEYLATQSLLNKMLEPYEIFFNQRLVTVWPDGEDDEWIIPFDDFFRDEEYSDPGCSFITSNWIIRTFANAGALGFARKGFYTVKVDDKTIKIDEEHNHLKLAYDVDNRWVAYWDIAQHSVGVCTFHQWASLDRYQYDELTTKSFVFQVLPVPGAGITRIRDPQTELSTFFVNIGQGLTFFNNGGDTDQVKVDLGKGLVFDGNHIDINPNRTMSFQTVGGVNLLSVRYEAEHSGLASSNARGLYINIGRGLQILPVDMGSLLEPNLDFSLGYNLNKQMGVHILRGVSGLAFQDRPEYLNSGIYVQTDGETIDINDDNELRDIAALQVQVYTTGEGQDSQKRLKDLILPWGDNPPFIPERLVTYEYLRRWYKSFELADPLKFVLSPDNVTQLILDLSPMGFSIAHGGLLEIKTGKGLGFDANAGVQLGALRIVLGATSSRGLAFEDDKFQGLYVQRQSKGGIGCTNTGLFIRTDESTIALNSDGKLTVSGDYVKTDLSNLAHLNSLGITDQHELALRLRGKSGLDVDTGAGDNGGLYIKLAVGNRVSLIVNDNGQLTTKRSDTGAIGLNAGSDNATTGGLAVLYSQPLEIFNNRLGLRIATLCGLDVLPETETDSGGLAINLSTDPRRTLTVNPTTNQLFVKRSDMGALQAMAGSDDAHGGLGVRVDGTSIRINDDNKLEVTVQGGGSYHASYGLQLKDDTFSVDANSSAGLYFSGNALSVKVTDGIQLDGQGFITAKIDDNTIKLNTSGQLVAVTSAANITGGDGIDITNNVIKVKCFDTGLNADFMFDNGILGLSRHFVPRGGILFTKDQPDDRDMGISVFVDQSTIYIDQTITPTNPIRVRYNSIKGLAIGGTEATGYTGLEVKIAGGLEFDASGNLQAKVDSQSLVLADFGVGVKLNTAKGLLKEAAGIGINFNNDFKISSNQLALAVAPFNISQVFVAQELTAGGAVITTIDKIYQQSAQDVKKILVSMATMQAYYYTGPGLITYQDQAKAGLGFKIRCGAGLQYSNASDAAALQLNVSSQGLQFVDNALELNIGSGLGFVNNALVTTASSYTGGPGVTIGEDDVITLDIGDGLAFDGHLLVATGGGGTYTGGQGILVNTDNEISLVADNNKGLTFIEGALALNIGAGLQFNEGVLEATSHDCPCHGGIAIEVTEDHTINLKFDDTLKIIDEGTNAGSLSVVDPRKPLKVDHPLHVYDYIDPDTDEEFERFELLFDSTHFGISTKAQTEGQFEFKFDEEAGIHVTENGFAVNIGDGLEFKEGAIQTTGGGVNINGGYGIQVQSSNNSHTINLSLAEDNPMYFLQGPDNQWMLELELDQTSLHIVPDTQAIGVNTWWEDFDVDTDHGIALAETFVQTGKGIDWRKDERGVPRFPELQFHTGQFKINENNKLEAINQLNGARLWAHVATNWDTKYYATLNNMLQDAPDNLAYNLITEESMRHLWQQTGPVWITPWESQSGNTNNWTMTVAFQWADPFYNLKVNNTSQPHCLGLKIQGSLFVSIPSMGGQLGVKLRPNWGLLLENTQQDHEQNGLFVQLMPGGGLGCMTTFPNPYDNGLYIKVGPGIDFNNTGEIVPILGNGLQFASTNPDAPIQVHLGNGLQFNDGAIEVVGGENYTGGPGIIIEENEIRANVQENRFIGTDKNGVLDWTGPLIYHPGGDGLTTFADEIRLNIGAGLAFNDEHQLIATGGGTTYTQGPGIIIEENEETHETTISVKADPQSIVLGDFGVGVKVNTARGLLKEDNGIGINFYGRDLSIKNTGPGLQLTLGEQFVSNAPAITWTKDEFGIPRQPILQYNTSDFKIASNQLALTVKPANAEQIWVLEDIFPNNVRTIETLDKLYQQQATDITKILVSLSTLQKYFYAGPGLENYLQSATKPGVGFKVRCGQGLQYTDLSDTSSLSLKVGVQGFRFESGYLNLLIGNGLGFQGNALVATGATYTGGNGVTITNNTITLDIGDGLAFDGHTLTATGGGGGTYIGGPGIAITHNDETNETTISTRIHGGNGLFYDNLGNLFINWGMGFKTSGMDSGTVVDVSISNGLEFTLSGIQVRLGNGLQFNDGVIETTGGGGDTYAEGPGIAIEENEETHVKTISAKVDPNGGLVLADFGIGVRLGDDLRFEENSIETKYTEGRGVKFTTDDETGLIFLGADISELRGLEFVNGKIATKLGDGLQFNTTTHAIEVTNPAHNYTGSGCIDINGQNTISLQHDSTLIEEDGLLHVTGHAVEYFDGPGIEFTEINEDDHQVSIHTTAPAENVWVAWDSGGTEHRDNLTTCVATTKGEATNWQVLVTIDQAQAMVHEALTQFAAANGLQYNGTNWPAYTGA